MKKFRWICVYLGNVIAFSVLAFCITLPLGITGFWSGYIGWAIVLPLTFSEMDEESREAIKKWLLKKKEANSDE